VEQVDVEFPFFSGDETSSEDSGDWGILKVQNAACLDPYQILGVGKVKCNGSCLKSRTHPRVSAAEKGKDSVQS